MARFICQEPESHFNLRNTVEALCWLALNPGSKDKDTTLATPHIKWGPTMHMKRKGADLGLNLLSTAAYFDLLPLAKRLVPEGHNP